MLAFIFKNTLKKFQPLFECNKQKYSFFENFYFSASEATFNYILTISRAAVLYYLKWENCNYI